MDKKAVWVLEASSLSGGVKVIYEMASGLSRRGWHVSILSLNPPPQWYDVTGIHWRVLKSYDEIRHALRFECEGTAKIATWWRTALAFDKETLARKGECFYLVQDDERSYYYRPFERDAVAQTYDMPFVRFSCNRWPVEALGNTAWVGQAYDPKAFRPMKYVYPCDRTALSIIRRQALKGFSELGEFSRRLHQLDSKAELWTFGADQGIQLVGSHSRHIHGASDGEVCKLYNEATCFVTTELHVGFCLPALEAMACGTPVVCFRAEGNEEFCKHEVNCLMSEKGDVKTLAEYAVRAMTDRALRAKLKAGGLETARRYASWDAVVSRLENVLTGTSVSGPGNPQ